MASLPEIERALYGRLDALGPAPRAELLHVLMLPDFERADRIGEFWELPAEPRLRRVADRLRGGSDAPGGTRREVAGGRPRFVSVAGRTDRPRAGRPLV
jgi:hypothetical protein